MILNVKLLPDKSGRVLIHWLQEDTYDATKVGPDSLKPLARLVDEADSKEGAFPIRINGHPQLRAGCGQATVASARIACNPKQNTVQPQHKGQEVFMCMHSNDIRAVTCEKCLATHDAVELLKQYENTVEVAAVS